MNHCHSRAGVGAGGEGRCLLTAPLYLVFHVTLYQKEPVWALVHHNLNVVIQNKSSGGLRSLELCVFVSCES